MNGLYDFMVAFCSGCILLGFLYMITPDGSMKQPVKYVFCLCFLCCIFSCMIKFSKLSFSKVKIKDTEIITESNSAFAAKAVFMQALNDENINYKKIIVDTNKLSDGSIIIDRVTVYTDALEDSIIEAIGSDSYEVVIINE